MTRFYNRDGSLTGYGLSCGYIERLEYCDSWKELYMEHSHYHVRYGEIGQKWQIWETFEINELTKARRLYKSIRL